MSEVRPPIIIVEGLDVSLHPSIEEAALQMEPPDAEEYRVFDAEGRLLKIVTDGKFVRLQAAEEGPGHADELSQSLKDFLVAVGVPPPEGGGLNNLVQTCINAGFLYHLKKHKDS